MKLFYSLPSLLAFIVCFFVGNWIGSQVNHALSLHMLETPMSSQLLHMPTYSNGQRSLLIVIVDRFNKNPELRSIWLLSYLPGKYPINFMPIYPSISGRTTSTDPELIETFNLMNNNKFAQLDPSFLKLLETRNFWWSGYILLDEVAQVELIDLFGEQYINGNAATGKKILEDLSQIGEETKAGIHYQGKIIQKICWNASKFNIAPDIGKIADLIPDHISTDLAPSLLLDELQSLIDRKSDLSCTLPTFTLQFIR